LAGYIGAVDNPSSKIYVVGHKRPDLDAAVSAVMAARLLQRQYPERRYQALLQGEANPQTAWLFAQAGIPLPLIRDDVRPTVGESCTAADSVTLTTPLGEAVDRLREKGYSLLPVVDAEGKWRGAISTSFAESRFLFHFNVEDYLGQLLDLPDLPRGLPLVPLNAAARQAATGARGCFQIFQADHAIAKGDVVLAADPAALAIADRAGAAAVILAGGAPGQLAAAVAPLGPALAVWHYQGSLLALVSQLGRAIPVGAVMSTQVPVAKPEEVLEDLRPVFARTAHALPVLDGTGQLRGVISRREALQPPRPGLVLVDHFEKSQTVRGVEACDILEIIDHHRVGAIETVEPARVDCRPVGSTSTIIALRFEEAGLEPAPAEARLLLGAMIADTLLLTSPTTTDIDRRLAPLLAARAGVELCLFGREVLSRNDGLATDSAPVLVHRDLKEFARGEVRFLLGQIETIDLQLLTPERRNLIQVALEQARSQVGAQFALTMVTDVLGGTSHLILADPDPARARWLLECADPAAGVLRPGLVSRKKQLVPLVLHRLADWKK
jgi:manganese-dependent inorganic pyrophosphatase